MSSLAKVLASSVLATACGRIGYDTDGPFAELPAVLELDAECGVMPPPPASLTITNAGRSELEIVDASSTGGFSLVTALPLVIAPGASATLDIAPPLAVIGTDRAGDRRTGRLTLETNESVGTRQVELGATVVGADLVVTGPGGIPLTLDLTATGGACPTPATVELTNAGRRAVELVLSGSSTLALNGFTSGLVAANSTVSFTVGAMTSGPCASNGSVEIAAIADCEAPPTVLTGSFVITGSTTCSCS